MQLHDVKQLVCNPVSSRQAAAAAREVGLLDAPGLGRVVFGADEQAVAGMSDYVLRIFTTAPTKMKMPTIRISACSGIFQYALMSNELRASSTERAVRYRCTWL